MLCRVIFGYPEDTGLSGLISMFEKIEKLLETDAPLAAETAAGVTPFDLQMATGVCLVAAAKADQVLTPAEREQIVKALSRQFHLPAGEAAYTLNVAASLLKNPEKLGAFAELVRRHFPLQQRITLLGHAWKIVTSDQVVTGDETQMIGRIQEKLGLTDEHLTAAKHLVSRKKI